MKKKLLITLLLLVFIGGSAQRFQEINKLEESVNSETDPKKLANVLYELSELYESNNSEKAMENARRSLAVSKSLQYNMGIVNAYNQIGVLELNFAQYQAALDAHYSALRNNEETNNQEGVSLSNLFLSSLFVYRKSVSSRFSFWLSSFGAYGSLN